MFYNEELQNHLETSSTIRLQSKVIAEWNMNIAENILRSGNYRNRPNDTETPEYNFISQSFAIDDTVNKFYTDATDADVVIDGGVDNDGTPLAFISKKEKERLLYSLEDCFGRFRPRSGINKLRYFDDKYTHFSNVDVARRPRYYIADKSDKFKYWTSYRTEGGKQRGIANITLNDQNFIQDAAPFVVYKNVVPANRIVVKMQTHIGDIDLGPFVKNNRQISDPFFGESNKATPVRWKVQYLSQDNSWIDALTFDENSTRRDGSPIIGSDGYVELFYGLSIPDKYRSNFNYIKELTNSTFLPSPTNLPSGTAYFIRTEENSPGLLYIVSNNNELNAGQYEILTASYGWRIDEEEVANTTGFVTDLVNPPSFTNPSTQQVTYREFQYIKGIRIVVETMNVFSSTFDLIEMSPRLTVDISDKVVDFTVTRSASDLGVSGLPIGQLLAAVGSINIFDYDQAFFQENPNSIVSEYISQHIQFKFYEVVQDVNNQDFYIPIKTMYSEGFPQIVSGERRVSMELRDLFFYFESLTAPQIFVTNVSISYAVSLLLDYVGFSNYVFLRNDNEDEEVIPFFFVAPDQSLAQILNQLAVSTQTAMFFDEYNNFILMSKGYILPSATEREVDVVLRGSQDFEKNGALKNQKTQNELANILEISFVQNQMFNDGVINYVNRSIQRSYGSIQQSTVLDKAKTWIYKPVLLWEVTGQENTRSVNEEIQSQTEYALTATPLNSDLSNQVPYVQNHQIVNNIIDFGDGVYWTARFNGYFFANGEIIRYDAIQFSIPGLTNLEPNDPNIDGDSVWISSLSEYQKYFAKIPFNGKMYPTGLVRIYAEPHYEVLGGLARMKNGPVAKHGRCQFGTGILNSEGKNVPVYHSAGLDPYWSNLENRRGVFMDFKYFFNERINRVRFDNVSLYEDTVSSIDYTLRDVEVERGTEYAILNVEDASLAKIGDYVFKEYDSQAKDDDGNLIGEPTINLITQNARIVAIDAENNRITIDRPITAKSDTELQRVDTNLSVVGVTKQVLDYEEENTATVTRVSSSKVLTLASGTNMDNFRVGMDVKNKTTASGNKNIIPANAKISAVNKKKRTVTLNKKLSKVSTSASFTLSAGKLFFGAILELDENESFENISVGLYVENTGSAYEEWYESPTPYVPEEGEEAPTNYVPPMTQITKVDEANHKIYLNRDLINEDTEDQAFTVRTGRLLIGDVVLSELRPETSQGKAGIDVGVYKNSSVSGVIKNIYSNEYREEIKTASSYAPTVQASALTFKGNVSNTTERVRDFISYIYKPLEARFRHFGTRMRIIGRIENSETRGQIPEGGTTYYVVENTETGQAPVLAGGSGGLAVMINPENNNGYYFELAALTENNLSQYSQDDEFDDETVRNVLFYKIERSNEVDSDSAKAIPVKLFSASADILVDEGTFVGQSRLSAEENTTVYDLAVEYEVQDGALVFYLYINNALIGIARDETPLPIVNNMALFVRGNARCMFENVYALTENYSQNTTFSIDTPVNSAFGQVDLNAQNTLQKYSVSGLIQSTYLSGISAVEPPKYNIYFEEFGTIMREAAYFNVKYDKAYPALYAQISPTLNRVKGFTVSGFFANSYGAEFLIFNHTDSVLNLDSSSGNYLRIQGVTFTQQASNSLTVDEYFQKKADFADPEYVTDSLVESPVDAKRYYTDIKLNRLSQGKNEFVLDAPYLQTRDSADKMMSWISDKVMKPRRSAGIRVFGLPNLQLGDIVNIDYTSREFEQEFNEIAESGKRFVIYHIEYSRSQEGPSSTVYVTEVPDA